MKENKRAFTLIELLAVIVVLTIILLITVPAINEVIKNSRKESFRNNVLNLFEAVKKLESNSDYRLDEEGIKYNDKRLNISNNPFTGGKIYLNENGEADSDKITDDRFCAVGTKKKLLIAEGNCDLAAALSNIDFKQKPSKQGWYRGKEITVDIKGFEDYPYTFSFSVDNGKTFHKISNKETPLLFGIYEGQNAKDFYKNEYKQIVPDNLDDANILVRVSYGNDSLATAYKVTMVDSTGPTDATVRLVRRNTDTMYVLANAIENDSYITKYEFKIDDGNYVDNGGEPSFKFSNVTQEAHTVTARISNVVGDSVEVSQVFDPAELVAPTITEKVTKPGENGWAQIKKITITYPMDRDDTPKSMQNNYEYIYWLVGSRSNPLYGEPHRIDPDSPLCKVGAKSPCKINTDRFGNKTFSYTIEGIDTVSTLMARVQTGTNKQTVTATIDKVDGLKPTIQKRKVWDSSFVEHDKITLHITAEDDGESGIAKIQCKRKDKDIWQDAKGTVCVISDLEKKTKYELEVKITDNAGNTLTNPTRSFITQEMPKMPIKMTQNIGAKGTTVKVVFPNYGEAAIYEYKIGNNEWKTVPGDKISGFITEAITVHKTPLLAQVRYNNDQKTFGSIYVDVDVTAPTCTWSAPSNNPIKNGATTDYTLTCTDDYGEFNHVNLSTSSFESSNSNVLSVYSVTKTSSANKKATWKVTAKGGATSGDHHINLKSGAVLDEAGNKTPLVSSSNVKVDNVAPVCSWSSPSNTGWLKNSGTTTYTLTCTDAAAKGFSDNSIVAGNIQSANTGIGTVTAVSEPVAVTNGYKWTVTVKAATGTGSAGFRLVAGSVVDKANNGNALTGYSTAIKVDNSLPVCKSTSQGGKGTSVKGTVTCTDTGSGCTASTYSTTYSSNGTKTIQIKDNAGNARNCSINISNVITLPTLTCKGTYSGGRNECGDKALSSSGKCKYYQINIDAHGGSVTGDSVTATINGVSTCTNKTIKYNSGVTDCYHVKWTNSYWLIGHSVSPPNTMTVKVRNAAGVQTKTCKK